MSCLIKVKNNSLSRKFFSISTLFKLVSVLSFLCLLLTYSSPYIHPNTIKILPFLGLGYPIIVLVNCFILIVWTIARSRWAIYSLFIILLGGKLHFRTLSFTISKDTTKNTELKVISYNVRLFDVYNPNLESGLETRNQIFQFLRNENPDVVCFQEFYSQDKPTRFETMDSLFQVMGTKIYHQRSAYKRIARQNFGIAMFSKYPMIAKGDVMFETQGSQDFNYCIYADIVKDQDTFRIYDVHLQSIKLQSDYYSAQTNDPTSNLTQESAIRLIYRKLQSAYVKRADQARRVVNHIKTSPYPTIVCGDFNDTPMSYTYNQFDRVLTDAFRNTSTGIGVTYVGKMPAGRIDYIFHSPELASNNFKIQQEVLSDHRAISCIISK
ncbi:MAG: endonuclease/exonuclease/phosphatase family protein [Crocinitomicaceae bacterium]